MANLANTIRHWRAHGIYFRLLGREFRWTLLLVMAILAGGSLLFHFFFEDPQSHVHPDYAEAVFRTFNLMTFNLPDSLPPHPVLRIWCFMVPFLSFAVVSEGVVRLAVLLTSKTSSGGRWAKAMTAVYHNHIILCGMGRLGYWILMELRKMEKDVVIIEKKEDAFGVAEARRLNVPVVIADARDEGVVAELGICKAAAVIAATDDDLTNLEIALDARAVRPDLRVVVRMFNQRIAEKIARHFDIKLIFSTSSIAAPSFAAASLDRYLVNSFYIDDKQLQTVKIMIERGSPLIGKSLGYLRQGRQLTILSHRRHNQEAVLFPAEEITLQERDKVAVLGQSFVVGQLHELNRPREA